MASKKKPTLTNVMPKTQFVRLEMQILGPDGVTVGYPYGWVSAPKLVSIETVPERMDFLLGLCGVDDNNIYFNGDIAVSRQDIVDGTFQTVDSIEIFDFSNGREYFTDKQFDKILQWNKVYGESLTV